MASGNTTRISLGKGSYVEVTAVQVPGSIQIPDCLMRDIAKTLFREELEEAPQPPKLSQNHLKQLGNSMATYLHNKNVPNIVFIDKSARPAYLPLLKAWDQLYPEERIPNIFFVSPRGFMTHRRHETMGAILHEFRSAHSHLAERSGDPVMIFDSCLHTGEAMNAVSEVLTSVGFRKIHKGLLQPIHKWQGSWFGKPKMDLIALDENFGCYPLGYNCSLVDAESRSVISKKTTNPMMPEYGKRIREVICEVFRGVHD